MHQQTRLNQMSRKSRMNSSGQQAYDFVIIGSGFGGSVSAMRLAEKGYTTLEHFPF
jgi:glycerol-3-phosphate dehydrogenase